MTRNVPDLIRARPTLAQDGLGDVHHGRGRHSNFKTNAAEAVRCLGMTTTLLYAYVNGNGSPSAVSVAVQADAGRGDKTAETVRCSLASSDHSRLLSLATTLKVACSAAVRLLRKP